MAIVQETDFVGEYKIGQTIFSDFGDYISTYEKFYLIKLFGVDLYKLFIADLTPTTPQTPQAARFLAVFNSFEEDKGSCVRQSEGIKKMLIQFIYFEIVRNSSHFKTNTGVVKIQGSVSESRPYNGYNLVEAYNKGVNNLNAIQDHMNDEENEATYPEKNPQEVLHISGI